MVQVKSEPDSHVSLITGLEYGM